FLSRGAANASCLAPPSRQLTVPAAEVARRVARRAAAAGRAGRRRAARQRRRVRGGRPQPTARTRRRPGRARPALVPAGADRRPGRCRRRRATARHPAPPWSYPQGRQTVTARSTMPPLPHILTPPSLPEGLPDLSYARAPELRKVAAFWSVPNSGKLPVTQCRDAVERA